MFQKAPMPNREPGHEPETVIAASVKVEGDFTSQGNVLIEGVVEGSLKTERDLRVGEKAKISADVAAANAIVAGEVRGNIVVTERLELEPTAKIFGDVRTKVLVVANGAAINGRLMMGAELVEERAVKSKAEAGERPRSKAVVDREAVVEEKEKRTINAFFTT
jgi:cytoskeletal protein CcmA (bactofilin family)